jgi:hypothetical protein
MINSLRTLVILVPVLFSSACAGTIDRTLSPPSNSKWVNVEVKNPSRYTKPFPLEVVYISHKCMKSGISGVDGSREEKPSYNGVKIVLLPSMGNSDYWRAKVAINGGGSCEWKLSEFNLGIEYIDATHLGGNLIPGTAVGATISFDRFTVQNGGFDFVNSNKLIYEPKLYPLIKRWSETKDSSQPDKLYLFGKKDAFWNFYFNPNLNENLVVIYKPSIDEHKVVEMSFPYEKKKGGMFKLTYPNGEFIMTKNSRPDFDKVDKMSIK